MRYLIDLHHGFGDVLHAVPAIRSIKQNDPQGTVCVIMSTQANIDFYRTQNLADEYILLRPKELIKYRVHMGLRGFDYGIVAPCIKNQNKAIVLLKFFSSRRIIKEKEAIRSEIKHRVEKNIAVLEKIGIHTEDPYPHLIIPELEKENAKKEFERFKQDGQYSSMTIALCLGGNYETMKKGNQTIKLDIKRWPVEYYHKLINMLLETYPGINLLLIGAKKDADDFWSCDSKEKIDPCMVYDYMGKTTMIQSGALLEKCDFAVGNDTGMIHLAAALDKPTMAVFCSTDPRKIGAYSKKAVYIEEYMECKYCYLSQATFDCKDRACLTQIKPDRVLKEVSTMISALDSGDKKC